MTYILNKHAAVNVRLSKCRHILSFMIRNSSNSVCRNVVFSVMFLLVSVFTIQGQGVTRVSGNIYDRASGDPLPFVNVFFKNTSVGTTTDLDGYFEIESRFVSDSLSASFLSYKTETIPIQIEEKNNNIKIFLSEASLQLASVLIVSKKGKYRKKDNPAVELMRKVIKNKKTNRLEGQDYYAFDQYEKIQLDLNNITEDFKDRKIFNKFDLLWKYLDTSTVNGKIYLPIFLRETNSKVYYRKDPESRKEYREAIQTTKFDATMDDQSLTDALDFLYKDIDIYDNVIPLLDHSFISPISPLALNFYRFYILDTLDVNNINSIRLGFIPRNKSNFGFTGDLYVSNDTLYTVVRADFGIIGDIHLNFVRDLKVRQDFAPLDDAFVLTRDEVVIDYSVSQNGIGFYGTRSVAYENFNFEPAPDPDLYNHIEKVIDLPGAYNKDDAYWRNTRLTPLTKDQEDLYQMIDTLVTLPAYKRLVSGIRILTTGYVPINSMDIGPLPTFYSYNQVEGSRLRMGFETNFNFNKRLLLEGYGAYGFLDEKFKYRGSLTYSFNEDFKRNPRHYLKAVYQKDVTFPGQDLQFIQNDNVLLSFRRGATDKMLFYNELRFEYTRETPGFALDFFFSDKNRKPYGTLILPFIDEDGNRKLLADVETTTLGIGFEIAPNKQFIQGRQYRTPIINEYPIYNIRYTRDFANFLGGDYSVHTVEVGFFKRFNMSILGHSNVGIEAGKKWGQAPYTELFIPRANQSFAYQRASFNMMNFLEFVSDSYMFFRVEHFFKGFFFNRVPLFKKLKLRELATFKLVYGSLSDNNNPALNPDLPQFDNISSGESLTYLFQSGRPYMEGSIGVTNIFRILRIDLVKRFNYLEHPEVPNLFGVRGLGIRARFKVEF